MPSRSRSLPRFPAAALALFVGGAALIVSAPPQLTYQRVAAVSVDTSGVYTLTARHSGKLLDVTGRSTADGAVVDQWPAIGAAPNQQWRFTSVGGGAYRITSVNGGKALDVFGASTADGAAIVQWAANGGGNQAWTPQDAGGGYVTLVAQHSGKAIDVPDQSTTDGVAVVQWAANGGPNQQWKLTRVGSGGSTPAPQPTSGGGSGGSGGGGSGGSGGVTGTPPGSQVGPGIVSGSIDVHDPSMVRRPDGLYVLVGTAPGLSIRTSTDRTAFTYRGTAFPDGAPWTDTYTGTSRGNIWAPDISYHNGRYYMYYAASSFGSNRSGIFLATSSTALPGSWSNQGLIYSTTQSSDHNAIDPNLYVAPDGRWWLSLGSFWTGIKQIELDRTTGRRTGNAFYSLASRPGSTALEAPSVVRHGTYYYLFTSWDLCCRGASSTYRIMVGRATSPNGPFVDRNGTRLTSGGGTQIFTSKGRYVGPGGQSVITDTDSDLVVYHYYDAQDGGRAKLGINLLGWDASGWPYVH